MLFRKSWTCALLITFLAACGGGGNNQSSATSGAEASPGAMMTAGAMNAASPGAGGNAMQGGGMQGIESRPQAPIPASLDCGAVKPVWTNPRSHTYFESTSPMFGRTKNGSYMCPSAAVAAGFHRASGRRHRRGGGSMEGSQPSPAST